MPKDLVLSPDPSQKQRQIIPSNDCAGPDGAIPESALKTMETELQRRGLLKSAAHMDFHPLWFLAETERNIFLWRHGYSLSNQDEFDFWIDPQALIRKRLRQLETAEAQNPFINPIWSIAAYDDETRDRERTYLLCFQSALQTIAAHAEVLCEVLERLMPQAPQRRRVVLPNAR